MILSGELAGASELHRFRTEAEAIARLHHSNIVQIHEIGESEGRPYFCLEYVTGGSLEKKLTEQRFQTMEAMELTEQLARAVHAVHQCGIVHRDLKPGNILLGEEGIPKITDFGLAKKMDGETALTASGAILGTPSYMAPEQAGQSKHAGPAADIYALGAILYELLTGRPPFKAATAIDTLMQLVSEEPKPPSYWREDLPRDVDIICLKCLEKEPTKRYATAEQLADDLRRCRQHELIQAQPTTILQWWSKWIKRRPWSAALVGFCALLILLPIPVLYGYWQLGRVRPEGSQQADVAQHERDSGG
jgi:serine/threonine-protein kinase